MKLAIAFTTFLFAMMAAQAAVLSVEPTTDVNIFKRAPTNGASLSKHEKGRFDMLYDKLSSEFNELVDLVLSKRNEIKALTNFIEELERRRDGKTSDERISINVAIAIFEKELGDLAYQVKRIDEDRQPQADVYRELKKAIHDNNFSHLRKYLQDHSGEGV
ncbi:hypothetical protein BASA50_004894 [Batrachochytrium salamandrivorans]|uniref:RxLR effector protein n=1 Tax=Batrachochytrium salamandrivorans TaxID=1357716 RepID=A0ABQ8FEB5_9FUNG|nr:hypothetical protein BASA50_004894 [Batrachochytrium salamandrivorans]